ncbi:MAG TPA: nucleotidyltransferase family protein [bacterium]|nr:nucleotidyltransferase family protein [bacterium]
MSPKLRFDRQKIAELCRRYGVAELALFGSVLRDDFRADSDVDILVSFGTEVHPSLLELVELREDLKDIFGREVDLVERAGLRNPFRRRAILSTAEVVYAS